MVNAELDLAFVRSQFPAFSHPETGAWAHLENAGGSYTAAPVVELWADLHAHHKMQPGWAAAPSQVIAAAMDRSRTVVAATFAADPALLHFGPSTSMNTYVLARAFRPGWDEGDEIVVTEQDHEANSGVWRRLADTGIVVRDWRVDPVTGLLDPADLDHLLGPRTRLVAFTHASNVAATVNPVAEIVARSAEVGARTVVDGVSHAPHAAVDVGALGADVYLTSAYKTYGPHVGLMVTRPEVLDEVAHQGHFFNEPDPRTRLTPAGPDHVAIASCAGMVDYYELVHRHHFGAATDRTPVERVADVFGLFAAHEERVMAPLLELLVGRAGVRVIGRTESDHAVREPTVAFASDRVTSRSVYEALVAARVACGHGHFYAHRLVTALGLDPADGVVRLSMVHYTSPDEVARALDVLDQVL
jgi:selenocysteine lyase/cysteine desulfurase